MQSGGTERAFNVLFTMSIDGLTEAKLPLADTIIMQANNPLEVSFIFGEKDNVLPIDDGESKRIAESKGKGSRYYILSDARHNMHWNKGHELAAIMINDLLGLDVSDSDD